MGAVQKLATVVIVGLVGLATLLVIYLADEPARQNAEAKRLDEVSVERGIATYLQYCLPCHGPAGEGYTEKRPDGTPARIGMPLGGNTQQRYINQTTDPAAWADREKVIENTIRNGRGLMPAWGSELNDEQIHELILMIHTVDWNRVYNEAIKTYGGYPTPPLPSPTAAPAASTQAPNGQASGQAAGGAATLHAFDVGWTEKEITASPGQTIQLVNTGASPHNFSVDALKISVDMPAGQTVTATVPASAKPGDYQFYCNVPGHKEAGMVGTLHVVASGPAAGGGQGQAGPTPTPAAAGQAAPTQAAQGGGQAAGGAATLHAYDIGWTEKELTVHPGQTITLVNTGAAPHDFSVDALGISVAMPAGQTVTATVLATAKPGDYQFYCNVPGHKEAGMVGTLHVQ